MGSYIFAWKHPCYYNWTFYCLIWIQRCPISCSAIKFESTTSADGFFSCLQTEVYTENVLSMFISPFPRRVCLLGSCRNLVRLVWLGHCERWILWFFLIIQLFLYNTTLFYIVKYSKCPCTCHFGAVKFKEKNEYYYMRLKKKWKELTTKVKMKIDCAVEQVLIKHIQICCVCVYIYILYQINYYLTGQLYVSHSSKLDEDYLYPNYSSVHLQHSWNRSL